MAAGGEDLIQSLLQSELGQDLHIHYAYPPFHMFAGAYCTDIPILETSHPMPFAGNNMKKGEITKGKGKIKGCIRGKSKVKWVPVNKWKM
jgi:hypothetical protein